MTGRSIERQWQGCRDDDGMIQGPAPGQNGMSEPLMTIVSLRPSSSASAPAATPRSSAVLASQVRTHVLRRVSQVRTHVLRRVIYTTVTKKRQTLFTAPFFFSFSRRQKNSTMTLFLSCEIEEMKLSLFLFVYFSPNMHESYCTCYPSFPSARNILFFFCFVPGKSTLHRLTLYIITDYCN